MDYQVAKQNVELGHVDDGVTLEASQGGVATATATGVLVPCLGVSLQCVWLNTFF
jgi:hypothetical protein